jgi:hypothetical protein
MKNPMQPGFAGTDAQQVKQEIKQDIKQGQGDKSSREYGSMQGDSSDGN